MKLFNRLFEELTEATSQNWNLDDVIPVKTSKQAQQAGQAAAGQGQETKVIGKKETEKGTESVPAPKGQQGQEGEQGQQSQQGQEGEQGQEQKGAGAQGKSGEEKPGEGSVASGKGTSVGKKMTSTEPGKEPGEEAAGGKESSDIDKPGKEWMDDHSKIRSGDGTGKSIMKRVYQEAQPEYRRMKAKGQGTGAGNLMSKVGEFIKEEFDIRTILARIGTFKRKISESIKKKETYQAAIFNPVTQQTSIIAKGSFKQKNQEALSAIMFVALDTSGSISETEFKSALGYINSIARQFEKKEFGVAGEVYLLQWDTAVHPPLTKWKYINEFKPKKSLSDEEREQMKMKGGGGTDVSAVFKYLDTHFVKEIDGQNYFVFGDKMQGITGEKSKQEVQLQVKQRLKPSLESYKAPSWGKDDFQTPESKVTVKEGGFSNVPFLLFYTDGWFSPPDIEKTKLFGGNPGNILYIVTAREGIKNIRPKNYVFHNVHQEK